MAILKQGNKWMTTLLFGSLLVVLITLVFMPILPDSHSPCGERLSYAGLLRDVWNEKIRKQPRDMQKAAEACGKQ